MRVVVPYVELHPQVLPALEAAGAEPMLVSVAEDDFAYTKLLDTLWEGQESFILVEQDILVRPGVLEELEECNHAWCGFLNDVGLGIWVTLGCTKFHTSLLVRYPGLIQRAARIRVDPDTPPGHWRHMDVAIDRVLQRELHIRGPHVHQPQVLHASWVSMGVDPQCRWCRQRLDLTKEQFQQIKERWGYAACGWCLPPAAGIPYQVRLQQLEELKQKA